MMPPRVWRLGLALWAVSSWLAAVAYNLLVSPFPGPPFGDRLTLYTLALWVLSGWHALFWLWVAWPQKGPGEHLRHRIRVWLWEAPEARFPPRMTFIALTAGFWLEFALAPAQRNPVWEPYVSGFRPYALIATGTGLLYLAAWRQVHRGRVLTWWKVWVRERRAWWAALIGLAAMALAIRWSGIGLQYTPITWQDTAPPLVTAQVLLALTGGWLLGTAWERFPHHRGRLLLRATLVLGLLAGTGFLWQHTPVGEEGFVRFPPPHYSYTPVSDARVFERAAQAALVGDQSIYPWDHHALLKALYWGLHRLFGPQIEPVLQAQIWLLTLWPLAVFILGLRLHSPQAGFTAALLLTLQQRNAIELGQWITTAHVKLLISEPWTGLGLAWLSAGLVLALQARKHTSWALVLGGGVVVLSLFRLNPLGLAPLMFLVLLLAWWTRRQWRTGLWVAILFLGGLTVTWTPWMTFASISLQRPPWYIFEWWRQTPQRKLPTTPTPTPTPTPKAGHLPAATGGTFTRAVFTAEPVWLPTFGEQTTAPPPRQDRPPVPPARYVEVIANHAVHNVLTAFFQLPTFPFTSFPYLGKLAWAVPFWKPEWEGEIPRSEWAGLVAWLFLLAVALGEGWRRARWAGIWPAIAFFGYAVAAAVGSSSGGRYILPLIWIVHLYAAMGLHTAFQELLEPSPLKHSSEPDGTRPARWPLAAWLLMPGVLLWVAWANLENRSLYPPPGPRVLLQALEEDSKLRQALAPYEARLRGLLQQRGVLVLYGRMVFPAFWPQGTRIYQLPYYPEPLPLSGLTFDMVGNIPKFPLHYGLLLALSRPPEAEAVPHAAEAYVVACGRLAYLLVTVQPQRGYRILVAEPAQALEEWTCPAPWGPGR